MDSFLNFAKGVVSGTYDNVATNISIYSGATGNFPTPPFNAVWFNYTDYPDPSDDPNREIVRVTGAAVPNYFIVSRGQENISSSVKNLASKTYRFIAPLTQKTFNLDIALSLPAITTGDPNGVWDGNPGRMVYDTGNYRQWFKITNQGILTGWL